MSAAVLDTAFFGRTQGDEICCHNSTCWQGQLNPITAKLRGLLGPKAILYAAECGDSIAGMAGDCPLDRHPECRDPIDRIAPHLDWVGVAARCVNSEADGAQRSYDAPDGAVVREYLQKQLDAGMPPSEAVAPVLRAVYIFSQTMFSRQNSNTLGFS